MIHKVKWKGKFVNPISIFCCCCFHLPNCVVVYWPSFFKTYAICAKLCVNIGSTAISPIEVAANIIVDIIPICIPYPVLISLNLIFEYILMFLSTWQLSLMNWPDCDVRAYHSTLMYLINEYSLNYLQCLAPSSCQS